MVPVCMALLTLLILLVQYYTSIDKPMPYVLWTTINKIREMGQTRCAHRQARRNALAIRFVQLGVCLNRSTMSADDVDN